MGGETASMALTARFTLSGMLIAMATFGSAAAELLFTDNERVAIALVATGGSGGRRSSKVHYTTDSKYVHILKEPAISDDHHLPGFAQLITVPVDAAGRVGDAAVLGFGLPPSGAALSCTAQGLLRVRRGNATASLSTIVSSMFDPDHRICTAIIRLGDGKYYQLNAQAPDGAGGSLIPLVWDNACDGYLAKALSYEFSSSVKYGCTRSPASPPGVEVWDMVATITPLYGIDTTQLVRAAVFPSGDLYPLADAEILE